MAAVSSDPILFYDGVCGFCDRAVQFVLRHDTRQRFRFTPLQSGFAHTVLGRHGCKADALDTMYLLLDAGTPGEQLLSRSDGIVTLLRELGGGWKVLAALTRLLPRALRDRAYDRFARNRYRWFGRYDQCLLPPPAARARFLDDHDTDIPRRA